MVTNPDITPEDRVLLARLIDRTGAGDLAGATLLLIKSCLPLVSYCPDVSVGSAITELERLLLRFPPERSGDAR